MILFSLFLIVFCCLIIWKASDGFETASEYIGRNLSDGVRGATINAIGSSMPELLTTLFFLFILKDKDGFAGGIGTTAGSAIFNGMIIPAAVILVVIFKGITSGVQVSKKVILRDGIALLLCEVVLIFLIGGNTLTWIHGFVLMVLYFIYAAYMFLTMKTDEIEETEVEEEIEVNSNNSLIKNLFTLNLTPIFIKKEINTKNAWSLLLFSMVIIGAACMFLVKSCEWLGDAIHVPIYFIAVILASAATSIPDTVLSMKDAKKGNYDDAVSNALGSNIFDVCFALGFPLFLFTLIYGLIELNEATVQNVAELRIFLLFITLRSFSLFIIVKNFVLKSALFLLTLYVLFTLFILGESVNNPLSGEVSNILLQINSTINELRFITK